MRRHRLNGVDNRRVLRAAFALTLVAHALFAQSPADAKGKYTLVGVADASVPAAVTTAKGTWTVRDGWVEIYSNGSWLMRVGTTDPKGKRKTSADFGSVTRAGDSFTFKSAIYGTHGATLGSTTLELSYDVVGDTTSERLVFARPGQKAPTVAAAAPQSTSPPPPTTSSPASPTSMPAPAPSPSTQPASPSMQPSPTPPTAVPTQPPTNSPTASGGPVAESGPPPFDLEGVYRLKLLNGRRLPIGDGRRIISDGVLTISPEQRWKLQTTTRGDMGGIHFAADTGAFVQSGARLIFSSEEFGDFEGVASGHGTITTDFYFFGDPKSARYAWVKDGVDDDPSVTSTAPRSASTSSEPVTWSMVSAAAFHACALSTSGKAYCWGLRAHAPGSAGGERPTAVGSNLAFSALSTGNPVACSPNREDESCATNSAYHTCAITASGEAYCWGSNQFGQLGEGSISESAEPKRVAGGLSFTSISAGNAFTCGITTGHDLYCWGRNSHGQLGIGSSDPGPHPEPRAVAQGVRSVSAGGEYACAVRDDGTAYCWGNGSSDRIGTDGAVGYGPNPSPLQVQTDQHFMSISTGRAHTCALTDAGAAYCWGSNSYLESGPGMNANHGARLPAPVPGVAFVSVSAGTANHSCGVTAAGATYCWGNNNKNQLGAGNAAPETCGFEQWGCSSMPVAVFGGLALKSVSAGVEFTCGVTSAGDIYCWGDNSRGQLGTGDRQPSSRPKKVTAP